LSLFAVRYLLSFILIADRDFHTGITGLFIGFALLCTLTFPSFLDYVSSCDESQARKNARHQVATLTAIVYNYYR
jgi:hypothetical protein